jgi:hypothetical protein
VIKQVAKMLQTSAKGAQPRGEEAQRVLSVFAASLKNPTLVSASFSVGRVAGGAAGLLSSSLTAGLVAGGAAGLLSSSLKAGLSAAGAAGLLSSSLKAGLGAAGAAGLLNACCAAAFGTSTSFVPPAMSCEQETPPAIEEMLSWNTLTPHYEEDVIYALNAVSTAKHFGMDATSARVSQSVSRGCC